MYISLEMLSLPHVVYCDFFFCSHRAVLESFYIDSLYNFISGVPLICVNGNLVPEISML